MQPAQRLRAPYNSLPPLAVPSYVGVDASDKDPKNPANYAENADSWRAVLSPEAVKSFTDLAKTVQTFRGPPLLSQDGKLAYFLPSHDLLRHTLLCNQRRMGISRLDERTSSTQTGRRLPTEVSMLTIDAEELRKASLHNFLNVARVLLYRNKKYKGLLFNRALAKSLWPRTHTSLNEVLANTKRASRPSLQHLPSLQQLEEILTKAGHKIPEFGENQRYEERHTVDSYLRRTHTGPVLAIVMAYGVSALLKGMEAGLDLGGQDAFDFLHLRWSAITAAVGDKMVKDYLWTVRIYA